MSRREIIECDECGRACVGDRHWRVEWDPIDRAVERQDFCGKVCLLKKLGGEAKVIHEPQPYSWCAVKVGSFAWAMARVKDGASVRRKDLGPKMHLFSRFALERAVDGSGPFLSVAGTTLLQWLDTEWEEA